MTTKQWLSRAYNLRRRIEAKEMHLEELRTQAEHITADLTGMPRGSGTTSPVERVAVLIADLERELNWDWIDLLECEHEIRKTIELIEDPVVAEILSARYISYKAWHEIAEAVHYSISYVYKLHVKGLNAVQYKEKTGNDNE